MVFFGSLRMRKRKTAARAHIQNTMNNLAQSGIFEGHPLKSAQALVDKAESIDKDFFHPQPEWLSMAAHYGDSAFSGPWLHPISLAIMCVREALERMDLDHSDYEWNALVLGFLVREAAENPAYRKLGQMDKDEMSNAMDFMKRSEVGEPLKAAG